MHVLVGYPPGAMATGVRELSGCGAIVAIAPKD
jgi:hypothetical protein